jgi:hypothetical protein
MQSPHIWMKQPTKGMLVTIKLGQHLQTHMLALQHSLTLMALQG